MKKFDFQKAESIDDQQVLFGWGFISTENGEPYIDSQEDHIPDDVALAACVQFMKSDRVALMRHDGDPIGTVLSLFPLTKEIADSAGIVSKYSGALASIHIEDKKIYNMAKEGELTGFSIGGNIYEYEEM